MKCTQCSNEVNSARHDLGYDTCMPCGETEARLRVHCVVPMHKSNYVVITNKQDLKGINNKGGFHK
jgi:hypothetical protein